MKAKPLTTDELLTQFLHFCRQHYAKHSSEIKIGENAKEDPEFLITPINPKNPKSIPPVIPETSKPIKPEL